MKLISASELKNINVNVTPHFISNIFYLILWSKNRPKSNKNSIQRGWLFIYLNLFVNLFIMILFIYVCYLINELNWIKKIDLFKK